MLEIILDCLLDSLKMLPLIFLTYVVIEFVERKANFAKKGAFLSGKAAPVLGSLAGAFPQCGVSVMAAKLYDKKLIAVGSLLSVFVATSDEAFSILISSDKRLSLIPLLVIKITLGIAVGFIANAIFDKRTSTPVVKSNEDFEHEDICAHCHDHAESDGDEKTLFWQRYVFVPLLHALQTFCYVFVVTLVFGIFFAEGGIVGEEKLAVFLENTKYFSPFVTALVGLIPNCASSAVIATAYAQGTISFGAMTAGLVSNAGVGLAVLFKNAKETKRNVILTATLYLIGALSGSIISLASMALGI